MSVASGILEEDICYVCGLSTLDKDAWENVVLCDICDAEYHLGCVGLTKIPRSSYVCSRCDQEIHHFDGLKFSTNKGFQIAKTTNARRFIYSPSKPLNQAWEECQKKGIMLVSDVFSFETMQKLTHGIIERKTSSGRLAETWKGATDEVAKRLTSSSCHGVVDRDGRYDLKLPRFVVEALKLEEILAPILTLLRSIMGTPEPQIRTHNVVFVPVGSKAQEWHVDDNVKQHKLHRYFTILIHLNSLDAKCGGTEIWINKLERGDMVRGRPGDALVFNGSMLHRGQPNNGKIHRYFYYCSFSCGGDANVGAT